MLVIVAVAANVLMVVVAGITGIQPFTGPTRETPKRVHEAPAALWLGPLFLGILSLGIGLYPALVDTRIIMPAVSALAGEPVDVSITIWHGFNVMLALSGITVALGILLYFNRDRVRALANQTYALGRYGTERGYDEGLVLLDRAARGQTRILQSGYLRFYLLIITAVTTGLVGWTLLRYGTLQPPGRLGDVRVYELGLAFAILAAAFIAVRAESRLTAVAALGVIGYSVATIYILYGAPDLAMTQVLVETLTVILFVLVLYRLPRFARLSATSSRVRDAIVAASAGALMTALVLVVSNTQFYPSISEFHAEQAYPLAHGRNVVNVILVDFRAIDTLGEIVVLAVAGVGVYALLRLRLWEDRDKDEK